MHKIWQTCWQTNTVCRIPNTFHRWNSDCSEQSFPGRQEPEDYLVLIKLPRQTRIHQKSASDSKTFVRRVGLTLVDRVFWVWILSRHEVDWGRNLDNQTYRWYSMINSWQSSVKLTRNNGAIHWFLQSDVGKRKEKQFPYPSQPCNNPAIHDDIVTVH